ncbi:MAG: riboflavin synthase [Dehalococcoidia bacterium]
MFTGIIEEVGTVKEKTPRSLTVAAEKVLEDSRPGDSIAINGACLTVTKLDKAQFKVDIMPETVRRTTIETLHYSDSVNLERAMLAGGRIGGHFVQGHVDGTGKVVSVKPEGDALIVRISAEAEILKYVVMKGFIAVDGASLTVIACDDFSFSVSLVSFTRYNTTLGTLKPGGKVNCEVDIMAKYIERLSRTDRKNTVIDFIQEDDFLRTR